MALNSLFLFILICSLFFGLELDKSGMIPSLNFKLEFRIENDTEKKC